MSRAHLIREAHAQAKHWVTLVDEGDGAALHRLDMHLPSGVVVEARGGQTDAGVAYATRCYFINRRTGAELACGSRVWGEAMYASPAELDAGLAAARQAVETRFASMVRIYERDRHREQDRSGSRPS